ncbi:MAG: NAD(P)-dependent oxidoreductase [Planctomycetota bacterium]
MAEIKRTYLITGITGMVARRLARRLLDRGQTVHGVARYSRPGSREELDGMGVTTWKRDLSRDSVDDMPDFDYVLHQAVYWNKSKAGAENRRKVMDVNAALAERVMQRWRDASAIMLASTGGVCAESEELVDEDTPVEPNPDKQNYHLAKFAMEQIAIANSMMHGTPAVVLRYYWPVDFDELATRCVDAAAAGKPVPGADPEEPFEWTPIDLSDVIDYTIRSVEVAQSPPRILCCGGPEVVTRRQLTQVAADVLGVEPVFENPDDYYWEHFLADSSRLYDLLGEPKRRLTDVVRQTAQETIAE